MAENDVNDTNAEQTGGQAGANPAGGDADRNTAPEGGEERSFQGRQGDPAEGPDNGRVDTDGDGRTRDPNDTRPTDEGGRETPVQRCPCEAMRGRGRRLAGPFFPRRPDLRKTDGAGLRA